MIEGEPYNVEMGINGISQTSSNRINRQRLNFIKRLADVANIYYERDKMYLIEELENSLASLQPVIDKAELYFTKLVLGATNPDKINGFKDFQMVMLHERLSIQSIIFGIGEIRIYEKDC